MKDLLDIENDSEEIKLHPNSWRISLWVIIQAQKEQKGE